MMVRLSLFAKSSGGDLPERGNISQRSIHQLVSELTPSGDNAGEGIKVFTIAYGSDADVSGLTSIANATGGQEYGGTPENIQQVYFQISEFF